MSNMISVKEAAVRWGLTERCVRDYCKEGKIHGAIKRGRSWEIPVASQRPEDGRIKSGVYQKKDMIKKLLLPIGISDYKVATTKYYYVDKTLMLRDFLDEQPIVSLFMRPRRFGKTLNMDMFRVFFEKTDEDTSVYFKDKKIWACGEEYRQHQGKYPVIFISFKDIKKQSWEETYDAVKHIIVLEYKRHSELRDSLKIQDGDYYNNVISGCLQESLFDMSLFMLAKMLHEHHGVAPIIIIDEYDTPILQGHICGFYDKIILFMRNLFSGAFKDNRHLTFGFMTGILRVAKESIFSGLNNIKLNSILDNKYSQYFGFTAEEVMEMAYYYNAEDKFDEICEWYDGYKFGKTEIFNPWSVINYFSSECEPRAFWLSTGNNEIISEILEEATDEIYERLQLLLRGETVTSYIDTGVIYPQIRKKPSSIYSFLLVAGYLKIVSARVAFGDNFMCELAIPNKEISYVYSKEILEKLKNVIPQSTAISVQEAVYMGNVEQFQRFLEKLLIQTVSCYDAIGENFYHGLILGLCALLENYYYISSNREAGEGRYDIQLMPKTENMPGIIIELKADKKSSDLKELAKTALSQIENKKYDTELRSKGITNILKYGVAFRGKEVEIAINPR